MGSKSEGQWSFSPERPSNFLTPYPDAPPPYDALAGSISGDDLTMVDSRRSSMQSLQPSDSVERNDRRKLLLIYVHGFMGDEASFRSFPAHVHRLLTVLLAETHIVHTKIYPRYRSKRNITFARDAFSDWLEPHEDPRTDVVLLGHSMGGLLSAEVVLMPPASSLSRAPLKHRIFGTVNFDAPFLGMHPGVVRSGLSSIFMPSEATHEDKYSAGSSGLSSHATSSSTAVREVGSPPTRNDTFWQSERPDPHYNPSFNNDVVLPVRKGWSAAWHFVSKHSDNLTELTNATKKLITSHMEFGGAMANYTELKTRYARIRGLEEPDENVRKSVVSAYDAPPRIRFVNYYTASTGKFKPEAAPAEHLKASPKSSADRAILSAASTSTLESTRSNDSSTRGGTGLPGSDRTPSISISTVSPDDEDDDNILDDDDNALSVRSARPLEDEDEDWEEAAESLTIGPRDTTQTESNESAQSLKSFESALPPIPDLPSRPAALDVSYIADKDTRKLVEKEHARAVKAYEKAVKEREKLVRDRTKLEDKQVKKAQKEAAKAKKSEQDVRKDSKKSQKDVEPDADHEVTQQEQEEMRLEEERQRVRRETQRLRGQTESEPEQGSGPQHESYADEQLRTATSQDALPYSDRAPDTLSASETAASKSGSLSPSASNKPPPKDRKFCMLPPKDSSGQRDPCWVRVFMENVDEVGAHCGLFFIDERYERLVGDVASKVEGWVREAYG